MKRINDQTADTLLKCIWTIAKVYSGRGFQVKRVYADNQFESIHEDLQRKEIDLNTCAREEHEPFVERGNQTVKEAIRLTVTLLPFKYLPRIVVMELVYS